MTNVLSEEKKQQVIGLDGWTDRCRESSKPLASVAKPAVGI
jgi:hypothetical protein